MTKVAVIDLPVERWREFRDLRLEALSDAPQAFGASYADEVTYADDHWIGRLEESERRASVSLFAERDGNLDGMIGAFFEAGPELATVVAVYVRPTARGLGVGRLLVTAVLDRLRELPGTQRAKLMVNVDQVAAVALYRSAGFVQSGVEQVPLGDGMLHDELVMECDLG